MYIKRHIETVIGRLRKRKGALVVTGARQVGKSTMLKEVLKNIRYISMDNPLVRESAADNPSVFFDVNSPPIIVDEIQKAANLFDYIKIVVDGSRDKGLFFLTGSQSIKLMKNISESLAGRAGVVRMLGLSARELDGNSCDAPFLPVRAHWRNMLPARKSFDFNRMLSRIHTGGFPELYDMPGDNKDWFDFYSSYFQTYIEKDIKDVLNIHDESAFIKFVKTCAALTGGLLNYSALAETCGKDVKTVQRWMSVLESSGLIYLLQPYFNNLNKRLIKTPKLYFLDTGFACWLLGWNTPEQLYRGAMWGHIFETYVIGEILKSYYNDGNPVPPLYFYRDKDKNEIDLVIEEGSVMYPAEIKASSDPVKSMAAAFKQLENIPGKTVGEGAVICLAQNPLPLTDKIWILPADLI